MHWLPSSPHNTHYQRHLSKAVSEAGPTCVWVDRQTRSTVQNVIIHRVFPHTGTFLLSYQQVA